MLKRLKGRDFFMKNSSCYKRFIALILIFTLTLLFCPSVFADSVSGKVTTAVILRKSASTSSSALATIKKDTKVTVLATADPWVKIKDGGNIGYIMAKYLDYSGKVSTEKTEKTNGASVSTSKTLRKGDDNDSVKALQKQLISLGYLKTDATGYFGSATVTAVKAFQKSLGLTADGIAGSKTLTALNNAADGSAPVIPETSTKTVPTSSVISASSLKKGDEGADVTTLQKQLITLGYLKTEATGFFGAATKTAVQKFQKDAGLTSDGIAGSKTLSALQSKAGTPTVVGSSVQTGVTTSGITLREGEKNDAVKMMQTQLIYAGYLKTDATGFFGSATATALRSFQKDQNFTADGVGNPTTLIALDRLITIMAAIPDEEDGDVTSTTVVVKTVEETKRIGDVVLEDWWSGVIDRTIKRKATFTVTDVKTGKSFTASRYGGSNHLDAEPLTAADEAVMEEIFNHQWTWNARAIWLTYDGVTYAAAMNGMPHGSCNIKDNNFDGMFCIHFLNSRTHGGNAVNPDMQARIQEAFEAAKK